MNSTQKSELINVLADGIPIPSAIPEANMKTCVMIDGHGLIQASWVSDVWLLCRRILEQCHKSLQMSHNKSLTPYTGQQSIKAVTRSKRVGKKRPIR